MNSKSEFNYEEQLIKIGSKSIKLIEKTWHRSEPTIIKLLKMFDRWLDKKLK